MTDPIDRRMTLPELEAVIAERRAELAALDEHIELGQALLADMEAHGHATAADALPCVFSERAS